jgi:hypothetical protein
MLLKDQLIWCTGTSEWSCASSMSDPETKRELELLTNPKGEKNH